MDGASGGGSTRFRIRAGWDRDAIAKATGENPRGAAVRVGLFERDFANVHAESVRGGDPWARPGSLFAGFVGCGFMAFSPASLRSRIQLLQRAARGRFPRNLAHLEADIRVSEGEGFMRALIVFAVLWAMSPATTRADMVVVPVSTDAAPASAAHTALRAELEQELAARRVPYLPAREAASKTSRMSRVWKNVSAEDMASFQGLLERAQSGQGSRANAKRAVAAMDELMSRALSAPEAYVSPELSDDLLAACLGGARASYLLDKENDARWTVMRCMVLLNQAVTERSVLPELEALFRSVDEELRQRETVEILVKATPAGCSAYLNGRELGSPEARRRHEPSALHWAHVECPDGRRSRIHTPQPPRAGTLIVDIDVDFDQALRANEEGVWLHYGRTARPEVLRADLARLARELTTGEALAFEQQGDHWQLTRSPSGTSASLPLSYDSAELSASVDKVLTRPPASAPIASTEAVNSSEGDQGTRTEGDGNARARDASDARTDRSPLPRRPTMTGSLRWHPLVSGAVLALGAAASITGGVLLHKRQEDGQRLRDQSPPDVRSPDVRDWKQQRRAPYALGAAGAVVLSAGALAMTMSFENDPPAWTGVVAGAAGIGLAAWGITDVARGASCDGALPLQVVGCSRDQEQRDRGAL
ncbi:MAG TPA: hypothetical protein VFX59_00425, partial [Polyangiales bacterium]|nr:hypothetical protein [Polyangiales bacterium]